MSDTAMLNGLVRIFKEMPGTLKITVIHQWDMDSIIRDSSGSFGFLPFHWNSFQKKLERTIQDSGVILIEQNVQFEPHPIFKNLPPKTKRLYSCCVICPTGNVQKKFLIAEPEEAIPERVRIIHETTGLLIQDYDPADISVWFSESERMSIPVAFAISKSF